MKYRRPTNLKMVLFLAVMAWMVPQSGCDIPYTVLDEKCAEECGSKKGTCIDFEGATPPLTIEADRSRVEKNPEYNGMVCCPDQGQSTPEEELAACQRFLNKVGVKILRSQSFKGGFTPSPHPDGGGDMGCSLKEQTGCNMQSCLPTVGQGNDNTATCITASAVVKFTGNQQDTIWCGAFADPVHREIANAKPGTWYACDKGVTRIRTLKALPHVVCYVKNLAYVCTSATDADSWTNL